MRHLEAPYFTVWPSSVSRPRGPSRSDIEGIGASAATVIPGSQSSATVNYGPLTHAPVTIAGSPRNLALLNETSPHCGVTALLHERDAAPHIARAARETARILRAHRLDELLAGIREWQRSTGPDRACARRNALYDLRQFKRLHLIPERRAFEAAVAVARSRQHRRTP